jgi:CHAT domain-containing protein
MSSTPIERGREVPCPADDRWAELAAGVSAKPEADALLAHAAGCAQCAAVLKESLGFLAEEAESGEKEMDPAFLAQLETFLAQLETSKPGWRRDVAARMAKPQRRSAYVYFAVAASLAFAVAGVAWWSMRRSSDPELLLAKAYTEARPFEYRLPDAGYGPVRQQRGAGSAFDRPQPLIDADAQIKRGLSAHPDDPHLLLLEARAQLLERDYEGAIASLGCDAKPGSGDPALLAVCGTALAVRGSVENRGADRGKAIDLFLKALKGQPSNPELLYNLALLYQEQADLDEAWKVWQRLLGTNPPTGWRQEAAAHIESIEKIRRERTRAEKGIVRDAAAFVAQMQAGSIDPEPYYDIFWTAWLPHAAEQPASQQAVRLAAAAFKRQFNDGSLMDAADAGTSSPQERAAEKLAALIALNQAGRADEALAAGPIAIESLEAARENSGAARGRLELAYSNERGAHYRACLNLTERVIRDAEDKSWIWLAGQGHLMHAACAEAVAATDVARAEIVRTLDTLDRAGLHLAALRARGFVTGIDAATGNYAAVWENAPPGLAAWWKTGASVYRAQEFQYDLFRSAESLDWNDCAIAMARSAIESVHRAGNPGMEAADRAELASLLAQTGDHEGQLRELQEARNLMRDMSSGPAKDDLAWDLDLNRAEAEIDAGRPETALGNMRSLEPAAATRRTREQLRLQQTIGAALFAMKRWEDAAGPLRKAIALNQHRAAALASYGDRVVETESAGAAYRQLAQIEFFEEHDPAAALRTWRLYRNETNLGDETPARPARIPLLTYAVLPDHVVLWMTDRTGLHSRAIDVPKSGVMKAGARLVQLCASPSSDEKEIRRLGHDLFHWLLAPELGRIEGSHVDLQMDSWLAAVPFGVLTDDAGRYLSVSYSFTDFTGAYDNGAEGNGRITADTPALIVSAPTAIAPDGRQLPELMAAARETSELAVRFRKPGVLLGREANSAAIRLMTARAVVFHFAGHGWSDGGNGALVLPGSANGEPHFITARELAGENWKQCSLAVLSACLTATGEQRGSVNNQSLVRALLSAGARRVVAARWSVDSESTRTLMHEFYEGLFAGTPAAEALSRAASGVSMESAWRHPYYWAGFQIFQRS